MEKSDEIRQFVLYSIVPILCSILVGFIFFPKDVFIPHKIAFQFIVTGIVASLFYFMMIFVEAKRAYIGLLFLFVMELALCGALRPVIILNHFFYIGGIGLTIVLYLKYFKQNSGTSLIYSAVCLAGLYPIVYILATEINLIIVETFSTDRSLITFTANTYYYLGPGALLTVLIGFAVGGGITLSERLLGSIEAVEGEPAPNSQKEDGHHDI